MAEHRGKPSGNPPTTARRGKSKSSARNKGDKTSQGPRRMNIRRAGEGGPSQQAGGPRHRGGRSYEDRNP
ncbi:MAG: hypothetical protein AB1813_11145 [Verrucomicrobiota bacterium]